MKTSGTTAGGRDISGKQPILQHILRFCKSHRFFRTDEIHSLSYFVEHERPLNSTNGTVSGNRNGIDELFEKLTKALGIELVIHVNLSI